MTHSHFRPFFQGILPCTIFGFAFVAMHHPLAFAWDKAALLPEAQAAALRQSSSQAEPASQSKSKRLANPLNDLLDEAQRHIDRNEFESAVTPLQKVIA